MMSKRSAKTRSEGDADSTYADISPFTCSDSSSYRNLEGGPYGDIPPESNRQGFYKDYVVFMLQENECSTGTSDYDDDNDDQELYSLRNEYLQKLNIVRRRLNLTEVNEDGDKYFNPERCTITEIIEEDDHNKKESKQIPELEKPATSSSQKPIKSVDICKPKIDTNLPKNESKKPESRQTNSSDNSSIEIQTLHPFSLCFNKINAESISNLLELEYNPPKKKSCFRLHTPKVPSASESNIPYHTKVSLHDGLFKKPKSRETTAADKQLSTAFIEKFTVTREIQCNEVELMGVKSESNKKIDSGTGSSPRNLFPNVIVKYESPREVIISSNCSTATSCATTEKTTTTKLNLPNFIDESSAESYKTVTTTITILDEPIGRKKEKKLSKLKRKSKLEHLWSDFKNLDLEDTGKVDAVLKEKNKKDKKKKKDFVQYITYRKDKKRAKSTPIKIKTPVPFGPIVLNDYEKIQNMDRGFYFFNSTSSEDAKFSRELYTDKFDLPHQKEKVETRRSWTRLFSCFESLMSIFRKSNKNVGSN